MNKRPLKYFFVKILFILTFLLGAKTALYSSENKFCLEDDGFITPIINSETICKEIITVSEFKHLINISHDKRSKSLKEFRILAEKKPIKEKELSKEEVKKASKEIIKKSTLEQKRLKRLADAKQKRIENQKKLLDLLS